MDHFLADFILFHAHDMHFSRQILLPESAGASTPPTPRKKKKHVFTAADFMGLSENRVPVNPLVSHYG